MKNFLRKIKRKRKKKRKRKRKTKRMRKRIRGEKEGCIGKKAIALERKFFHKEKFFMKKNFS